MALFCVDPTPSSLFLASVAVASYTFSIVIVIYGSIKTYQEEKYLISFRFLYYINNLLWFGAATGYTLSVVLALTPSCVTLLGLFPSLGFWGYGLGFSWLYLFFTFRLNQLFLH